MFREFAPEAALSVSEENIMTEDLSRRKFLERIGLGTAAGVSYSLLTDVARAQGKPLPSRTLGRTGAKVSILAFGCGSRFLALEEVRGAATRDEIPAELSQAAREALEACLVVDGDQRAHSSSTTSGSSRCSTA